jgi:hypothetical protein
MQAPFTARCPGCQTDNVAVDQSLMDILQFKHYKNKKNFILSWEILLSIITVVIFNECVDMAPTLHKSYIPVSFILSK